MRKEGRCSGSVGAVRRRRRTTAGMKVRKGKNQGRTGVGADRQIAESLPGIELPGGALSAYSPGLGPLDLWGG